jgi:hypothetical protein
MHLSMRDNQIGQKFTGLAPADMARLPHLINSKKVFSRKRPGLSAGSTYTYFELAFFYKGNHPFLTRDSPSAS